MLQENKGYSLFNFKLLKVVDQTSHNKISRIKLTITLF